MPDRQNVVSIHRVMSSDITIIKGNFNTELPLPLAPGIRAGFPSPAQDYLHDTLDFNNDMIHHKEATFYARVDGDSMRDAGIPMIRPVSGIAMGLIKDEDSPKYAVLSDILGDEDHLGDMDFKVTGTEKGITATQMDIKCNGLSYEILEKALNQAKEKAKAGCNNRTSRKTGGCTRRR